MFLVTTREVLRFFLALGFFFLKPLVFVMGIGKMSEFPINRALKWFKIVKSVFLCGHKLEAPGSGTWEDLTDGTQAQGLPQAALYPDVQSFPSAALWGHISTGEWLLPFLGLSMSSLCLLMDTALMTQPQSAVTSLLLSPLPPSSVLSY